ncbi:MAG: 2-amino-4-hydroxy-6-hydroxymethyldihydropteridine diphosphokinase, partial [Acidimicrobiia bacterium]|nr:2-amino-4-hydroxy-6-hydroxymethyldihydropteridine diphosphokinase [Acidimicrobiia bacterium]
DQMTRAAVALGSNLGDRKSHLRMGVDRLRAVGDVVGASPLFETAPIGGPQQDSYLNAVVLVETRASARELLGQLHEIEAAADRTRDVRWGPRTLDLDLVLYGHEIIEGRGITVPHPRFHERRFVLEPLLAVWPDVVDPRGRDLRRDLADVAAQPLTQVDDSNWANGLFSARGEATVGPSNRGGVWVGVQLVLLALTGYLSLVTSGSLPGGNVVRGVGVMMILASAVLGVAGSVALGRYLTPYPEPVAAGELVRRGVYRLVRHPIYGAVVLAAIGLPLVVRSRPGLAAGLLTAVFFFVKAGFEEARLERVYPEYCTYREATPRRLIPWVL